MSSPLSSSSSFDTDLEVNWDAFTNPAFIFPTTTQSTLPPSPALSPKEIDDPQVALADFLKHSESYQNIDPTLSFNNYPSPPLSSSPYPYIETPTTDAQSPIHHQVESAESPIPQIDSIEPTIRRRGPGRPSKAQLAREKQEGKQSTKSAVTIRRVIHNDSAMRSRARFNTVLDELWNEVPERDRMVTDPSRQLCRAEKIEIVISYVRKLQKRIDVNAFSWN